MSKVSTNICLDPELKKNAQNLFKNLGMDLTTAVTIFLTQAVRERRIPFEIKIDIPNETTKLALSECEEMEGNPSKHKRYESFSDATKDVL